MFSIFTTETGELDLDQAAQAVQRCTAAYFRIKSELPKRADDLFVRNENHERALRAFLAEQPVPLGIHAIQVYIACLSRARDIGAIDAGDVGHYLYPAQIAMQAWKLANPPQRRQERWATPPSKGNHVAAEQSLATPSEGEQEAKQAAKSARGTQEQLPPTPSKGNQPTPHEAGRQTTAATPPAAQSTTQPLDSKELLRSGLPLATDYIHPNPAIQQAIQPQSATPARKEAAA